jgi:hypothetical protein
MNTRKLTNLSLLGAALTLSVSFPAFASSHREAPGIALDPSADNTDLYAWVAPGTRDKLYIVAAYNPLQEPAGGPNFHKFDDDVRYEIHVARGPDSLDDVVTYYIRFKTEKPTKVAAADIADNEELFNGIQFFSQIAAPPPQQTYSVIKVEDGERTVLAQGVPVAPPNIGPRTDAVVYGGDYDDAYAASFSRELAGGGRVWAGPRDDGFYVDLGGVFDLANITSGRANPVDGVAGFNVSAIALEIPTEQLTHDGQPPAAGASDENTLGVWAAASRRKVTVLRKNKTRRFGKWVQVSRLGLPLVNEALIGLQDKDKYNRTHPRDDLENFAPYFLHPTMVKNAEVVGIYGELGVDAATVEFLKHGTDGAGRFDIINTINIKDVGGTDAHRINTIGDVLRVDLGLDSGFPNGRPLVGGAAANMEQADVTDVLLTVILAAGTLPVGDNVNHNDKDFLTEMPFLPLPWQGFDEGHGKPAQ